MEKLLIIDDDEGFLRSLKRILSFENEYELDAFNDPEEAISELDKKDYSLVLTDMMMPKLSGVEVLKKIKNKSSNIPVIFITGNSSVDSAVNAMKLGSFDYVIKPFNADELRVKVKKALEFSRLQRENTTLKARINDNSFSRIIGNSLELKKIFKIIEKVASSEATVMIYGESGTGKELVAKAVHDSGNRKDKPFVYVDCASLAENLLESELFGHEKGAFTGALTQRKGLFETANGGTLFLDEIGNISLSIQAKLLRVLQEKEIKSVGSNTPIKIDIRLIAATNKNLEEMVSKETFREDLFYRLNVVPVIIPPLRERKGDLAALINHFLNKFKTEGETDKKLTNQAFELLYNYDWPGNIRELENVIERMVILSEGNQLDVSALPKQINNDFDISGFNITTPTDNEQLKKVKKIIREKAVKSLEKKFIIKALEDNDWNISKAADVVGLKRENFYGLMNKCDVVPVKHYVSEDK